MKKDLSDLSRRTWIKESLAVFAALAGLAIVFSNRSFPTVAWLWRKARGTVQQAVPLELEIERARKLVVDLVSVLRKNHEVIIREQIEIDELRLAIASGDAALQKQQDEIKATRAMLTSASSR